MIDTALEEIEKFWVGNFGDKRLAKRGAQLLKQICETQCISLRQLGHERKNEVAFGRFLRNEKVSVKEIVTNITTKTEEIITEEEHVLAIQDTTMLNYRSHEGRVNGLGIMGNDINIGFLLHPVLVLDANTEACLGLANIHHSTRYGKADKDRRKPIEEKESFRWLDSALKAKKVLSKAKKITIIGDRESDIYECFDRVPDRKTELLVRAQHNRKLFDKDEELFTYLRNQPIKDKYKIEIKSSGGRKKRTAKVELRFCKVKIKRTGMVSKAASEYIEVNAIEVKEVGKKQNNSNLLHWRLLTTHSVEAVNKAKKIIQWYNSRWNIEELFKTLKTKGINVESSQVEEAESLYKLVVIALEAALKCLQLVQARDGKSNRPATDVFEKKNEEFLKAVQKKLEGKTEKQKNPFKKKTLAWASWIVGRLGGWKGYKSERPPGVITMNKGLEKLDNMQEGFLIAKNLYDDS